jgi:hypothetical protein
MPSGTGQARSASTSTKSANAPWPSDGAPSTRCLVPTTSPQSSMPGTYGRGGRTWYSPAAIRRSGKFSAAARTFTSS